MRTSPLPPKFHQANRQNLAEAIGPDAIAIIDTADVLTRAGDYEYPFRPDSNFYYLTGIAEPEAVLVLIPGHSQANLRELLFVSGTSEFVGTWEGQRLTPEQAAKLSGVISILPLAQLQSVLDPLLEKYRVIYSNAEESLASVMSSPAKRRARQLRQDFPLHELRSALPPLARQRTIKSAAEIEQLRQAIDITRAGLHATYRALAPGLHEYHLEAELTAEFLRHGSANAFMPIVAAGRSTTVIHHMRNDGPVAATDLVLLDVGAEHGFYAADISRTVPVSGRFTPRQRAVYEAVLRTQRAAITLLRPGVLRSDYETKVGEWLLKELVDLGVIKPAEAKGKTATKILRAYYPHYTSHFLGLDVHDVGDYAQPLAAGMVLTVEPGIYLKEEGIGVRLEDDVLITADGCEVLSAGIPSDPDAIEALIQENHQ